MHGHKLYKTDTNILVYWYCDLPVNYPVWIIFRHTHLFSHRNRDSRAIQLHPLCSQLLDCSLSKTGYISSTSIDNIKVDLLFWQLHNKRIREDVLLSDDSFSRAVKAQLKQIKEKEMTGEHFTAVKDNSSKTQATCLHHQTETQVSFKLMNYSQNIIPMCRGSKAAIQAARLQCESVFGRVI